MAKGPIKISIVSPTPEQTFLLKTSPVETEPIIFRAVIIQDGADITGKVNVNWQLKLSWPAEYKIYQTKSEISGNPSEAKFKTGGILRIRAAVIIDSREYSTRIKINIIGANPSKQQINELLGSDLLKAMAWQESSWLQFDDKGQPLPPVVPKGQKIPSMRGLFQISEWWWAEERTPLSLKDFNRAAWQWDYNIQVAKLILDYYRDRTAKNFPNESAQTQLDWALKAYKKGSSCFQTKEEPGKFWYVSNIKNFIKNRPWEK